MTDTIPSGHVKINQESAVVYEEKTVLLFLLTYTLKL